MRKNESSEVFRRIEARGPIRGALSGSALVLTLCVVAIGGCGRQTAPLQKAFEAVGGRDTLLELQGFAYESTGERFEAGQSLSPTAAPIRASSFDLSLLYDIENERLSFDWRRQIFDPLLGALAYKDIIDGDLGYQTGNDSVFNPPDASTDRALASDRIEAWRQEARLLNPLVYLRTAAMNEGSVTVRDDVDHDGRSHHVIEIADPTYPVELIVDAESGRVSMLRTLRNDHIWGDVGIEVSFGDWSSPEGSSMEFPYRAALAVAGDTIHTETRTEVVINPEFDAEEFALPDEPLTQVDPAAARRGALTAQYHTRWHALGLPADQDQTLVTATAVVGNPEIQYLTGGTHHSLALKLGDGIVVLEPPLNEARSKAVLAQIDELWPGVPVTHLILTHHHFDHMGGIRTYAARGATIVTSALNSAYVEEALTSAHTLLPDELAGVENPDWQIETVAADGEFRLDVDGRTVMARHAPTVHDQDMLAVYMPESRLLFVSDVYFPAAFPLGQPLPDPFGTWSEGLRESLATFEWQIEWIVAGHGGIDSFADFHSHFDR